eukprot:TRINITY_DN2319_c0_g2_i1.p1 TRINITY_DN2319_c0_g2~~TRINITY_DN2319_c0_g2_i1.p1  ORF type:complete len:138 (+),score=13.20 TRINITY_DN2319_c0_g2_i1:46-414(+)
MKNLRTKNYTYELILVLFNSSNFSQNLTQKQFQNTTKIINTENKLPYIKKKCATSDPQKFSVFIKDQPFPPNFEQILFSKLRKLRKLQKRNNLKTENSAKNKKSQCQNPTLMQNSKIIRNFS